MANKKTQSSLSSLMDKLHRQVDLLDSDKIKVDKAKAINQTSNQIMNGYKIQLSAYKLLGKSADLKPISGLLS